MQGTYVRIESIDKSTNKVKYYLAEKVKQKNGVEVIRKKSGAKLHEGYLSDFNPISSQKK